MDSELELVSFNQNFNQMDLWDESNLVVIEGYIRMRNNQLSIYFNNASKYIPQSNGFVESNKIDSENKCLVFTIKNIVNNDSRFAKLIDIINNTKNKSQLLINHKINNRYNIIKNLYKRGSLILFQGGGIRTYDPCSQSKMLLIF